MFVYSHTITPRLQYLVHFLSHYYRHLIHLTANTEEFARAEGIKINYSNDHFAEDALWIQPSGLLFEHAIRNIEPTCFQHPKGYIAFFRSAGIMQFDLFSAIFYLLSRYEEYLPHALDSYGRYAHTNSLAYQNNFLHQPLINIWLQDLKGLFRQSADSKLPIATFSFLPTYDIDMAWSYKHKGFLRNAGGLLKSVLKGKFSELRNRASVITGRTADPYDAFAWMEDLHLKYDLEPAYFFHVGQRRNKYDKNIPAGNHAFRQLIKGTAKKYKIGLHPSWFSGDAPEYLGIEKAVLEEMAGKPITASRQHYIRFSMPSTPRRLLNAGIVEDYSMGYGTINGFRASVASPFYWYDMEKEEQTALLIHPFCYMDANSFFELGHTPQQALEELMHYYACVKAVNGTLCTLWHNTFLGTDLMLGGWREVYESFIKNIAGSKV